MRAEIAALVFPVLNHALQLKTRIERGEELDRDTEQAKLRGYLQSDMEAKRFVDFGGDSSVDSNSSVLSMDRRGKDGFLGIRYALACWLDEIFIDSPWERWWKDNNLETALYGSRDRAYRFWDQARRAEARNGDDALEVFFLCVMLGFRGDYRNDSTKLHGWVNQTRARLSRRQDEDCPLPAPLDPQTRVSPRRWGARWQRTLQWGMALAVVSVLGIVFSVVLRLR
jgi:type VI secretion system protein ImpK